MSYFSAMLLVTIQRRRRWSFGGEKLADFA
jgi:hypothetical protein